MMDVRETEHYKKLAKDVARTAAVDTLMANMMERGLDVTDNDVWVPARRVFFTALAAYALEKSV
jgi:hypothetical protein